MGYKKFFKIMVITLLLSLAVIGVVVIFAKKSNNGESGLPLPEIIQNTLMEEEPGPPKGVIERPIAVMIDNHNAARPQSGFNSADLVYEMLAEGRITRYMMVFYSKEPKVVGPLRSAREYFIDRAQEHSAVYIHAGGSKYALSDLRKYNIPEIDGLRTSFAYRVYSGGRYAPHNLYAKFSTIKKFAKDKAYMSKKSELFLDAFGYKNNPLEEHESYEKYNSEKGGFTINYRQPTSYDSGYKVRYKYDPETKTYFRYQNGVLQKDEEGGKEVKPANVIIQIQPITKVREKGLLLIQDTGKGKGFYFNEGKAIKITWEKESRFAPTVYYFENGDRLNISSGQIFIQVVPDSKSIKW